MPFGQKPAWLGKPGPKQEQPESPVRKGVRELLRLMGAVVYRYQAGFGSEIGIPDLLGHLNREPMRGRAVYVECKAPGRIVDGIPKGTGRRIEMQQAFVGRAKADGAFAVFVDDPWQVVTALAAEGYPPAQRLAAMNPGKTRALPPRTP